MTKADWLAGLDVLGLVLFVGGLIVFGLVLLDVLVAVGRFAVAYRRSGQFPLSEEGDQE